MAYGGKREGAGRKKGKVGAAQQAAIDVAEKVLYGGTFDAVATWNALLTCGDAKVIADVLKYLTNRVHGCPTQRNEVGGTPDGVPVRVATCTVHAAGDRERK